MDSITLFSNCSGFSKITIGMAASKCYCISEYVCNIIPNLLPEEGNYDIIFFGAQAFYVIL